MYSSRAANLTLQTRIYGENAQEIAMRFKDRTTEICPNLGCGGLENKLQN